MRLELTGRHVEITPALRRLVEGKLSKLDRLLNDHAVSAHAVLTREKHRHRTDVTLHARGERFLHGVGDTSAWATSVSQAIERITQQAQKVKGKWQTRKGRASARAAEPEAAPAAPLPPRERESARMPRILRTSRQSIKPMSVAQAAREVDAGGDGLVVFRDVETTFVTIIYRRPNGELTLVQAEA
ncbi:MAG TPA: ribosome-associated translation inhibitor RaiA [Vicinamibacterales bacterium]|jgi:putative sigma-54 modulation protein